MVWFNKHLNWTLFIVWLIGNIMINLALFVVSKQSDVWLWLLGVYALMFIASEIWHLKAKGRSLWNLLYNLIPYIGIFSIMTLDNFRAKKNDKP